MRDEEDLRRRLVVRPGTELAPGEHDEAVAVAWAHHQQRGGEPCRDCAFRLDSPEMERGEALAIAMAGQPFFCHQGMPVRVEAGEAPRLGRYAPDDPRRYPACAGLRLARRGKVR